MHFLAASLALLAAPQGVRQAEPAVALAAATVEQGGVVNLELRFAVQPGWHVFHPDDASGMGLPPSVKVQGAGVEAAGPLAGDLPPKRHVDLVGGAESVQLWLEADTVLTLPVRVTAPPGAANFEAVVEWTECNDRVCLPPTKRAFPLAVEVQAAAGSLEAARGEYDPPHGQVKVRPDIPKRFEQGRTYELKFTLDVEPGFYVYHPDQDDNGFPTQADFVGEGFAVTGPLRTERKPKVSRRTATTS
jgi:DsbC/DsbD-like thiol-disulfide interchange protein